MHPTDLKGLRDFGVISKISEKLNRVERRVARSGPRQGPQSISVMTPVRHEVHCVRKSGCSFDPQSILPRRKTGAEKTRRQYNVAWRQPTGVVSLADTDDPVMRGKLRPSRFKQIPRPPFILHATLCRFVKSCIRSREYIVDPTTPTNIKSWNTFSQNSHVHGLGHGVDLLGLRFSQEWRDENNAQ
jgi:hypothetical protein